MPATPFRADHRRLPRRALPLQQAVIALTGRMEQARQGLALQSPGQLLRRISRQVEGHGHASDALAAQLLHQLGIGPPAHQHEGAGPPGRQPAAELLADAAKGPGNQVSSIRANQPGSRPLALADHHLAHVAGLGHQPEGLNAAFDREGLQRDRRVVAGFEVGQQVQ